MRGSLVEPLAVWRRGTILRLALNCTSATTVHPNTCPVPHCHKMSPWRKAALHQPGRAEVFSHPVGPLCPCKALRGEQVEGAVPSTAGQIL